MRPVAPSQPSSLAVRVVTAIGLGVVVLGAVLFGGVLGLAALIALVSAFAVSEFYSLERQEHRKPNEVFGIVAVLVMPFAAALFPERGLVAAVTGFIGAALVWHLIFRQIRTADTATTVFGALYVGFTLSHLVLLRGLPQGMVLVLVTVVSVWANDTFAYFVGIAVGRHKMSPVISPKKSWEGFLGGAVCALLVWLAAFSLTQTPLGGTGLPLTWLALVGVAVPLAALVGDLVESRFKREADAKDSGGLLPGHGGFLDRFDSMIAVSITVYYLTLVARSL